MSSGVSVVRIGLLLPGGIAVGEGVNQPMRCMAATHSGEIPVIAKKLPLREIAVEIVCAALGRAAGLPVPEPILLIDGDRDWHYGSCDLGHPNLAQYVSPTDSSVLDELEKWPELLHAACFDELIANPDRNDGNLLYDGAGFFLIDHGMCMPYGMSAIDRSDDYYSNQLLDIQIKLSADDISAQRAVNGAREWSMKTGPSSIEIACNATADHLELKPKEELLSFLRNRVAILGDLLHDRLKPSQQGRFRFNDQL